MFEVESQSDAQTSAEQSAFKLAIEIAHWQGQLLEYGKRLRRGLRDCSVRTQRESLVMKLALLASEAANESPYSPPAGLSQEQCDEAIKTVVERLMGDPSLAEESTPAPFRLKEDGLYYIDKNDDGEDVPVRICSPVEVIAATRNEDNEEWGRLIRVRDPENKLHEWAMPMDVLTCDGNAFLQKLSSLGLVIEPGSTPQQRLKQYLTTVPKRFLRAVGRLGWYNGLVFVLPDSRFGQASEEVTFQTNGDVEHSFRVNGSLEDWREQVGFLCKGNSRLAFAVSCAFATPLLAVVDAEGGGFNFVGPSSTGKTTALTVAGSVWGGGGVRGYLRTWRATANGLEATAAIHSDSLLCLDELGELPIHDAGEAAYMLANGQGKARARADGTGKKPARWRLLFLSSGEITLQDKMAESGKRARGGQLVRIVDIPADAGRERGLFEDLHGFDSAEVFSRHLKQRASEHYGAAIRVFLKRLTSSREDAERMIRDRINAFVDRTRPSGADPQVQRVCRRFGLIAAAGELATAYGITGWSPGEADRAAERCFRDWLEQRGHTGAADVQEAISQIRQFVELHGDSRFAEADADTGRIVLNRVGFKRTGDAGDPEYLVLPEAFKKDLCQGFDPAIVCSELVRRGMLVPDKNGRFSTVHRIRSLKRPQRVYHLTSKVLGDDTESGASDFNSDETVTDVTGEDVEI